MAQPGDASFQIGQPGTPQQAAAREHLAAALASTPIPVAERANELGLYMSRHAVGRVLMLASLYSQILDVQGCILQFGVRWGRDLAILQALRATLEPGNAARRIIGFDTFHGFVDIAPEDGTDALAAPGAYGVSEGWQTELERILALHDVEADNRYPRHELVRGDVRDTFPAWLEAHPETVVALAYFDMDLYEPTLAALQALRPYATGGAVLAFDETMSSTYPGETVALRETWGLDRVRLRRTPYLGMPAYFVVEPTAA